MFYQNLDLWLTLALAAAGVAVQLSAVPLPGPLKVAGGLLLELFCPGYALLAALLPGRSTRWPERALLSAGLSLAIAIVGAIAFNWLPQGLNLQLWSGLFLGVTLIASVVALYRRSTYSEFVPAQPTRPGLKAQQLALLSAAGLVTIAAVVLVRAPRPASGVLGYTLLWMTPDPASNRHVDLGIQSSELTDKQFKLQVTRNGRLIHEWANISLAPGETWTQSMELPADQTAGTFEARLYQLTAPATVYRRVTLQR